MNKDTLNKTHILLLAGQKFSGKSTVANYIKNKIPNSIEICFAGALKQCCKVLFNLSDDQLDNQEEKNKVDERWNVSPRDMFQKIGDLLRYELPSIMPNLKLQHETLLTTLIYQEIQRLINSSNPPKLIIISDGRLEDENKLVKGFPNNVSIRILRHNNSIDNHKSEQNNFNTDYIINNNKTLQNLFDQVDSILERSFVK